MRAFVRGLVPSRQKLVRLVRIFAFGLIGAGLSGCATQQAPQYAGVHHPVAERQWKVEIEEDGRPAQAPPIRQMRPEEDDPSQPWSPNYGKGSSAKPARPATETPTSPRIAMPPLIETTMPAATQVQASRRLTAAEADQVVLSAIQNHEARRP